MRRLTMTTRPQMAAAAATETMEGHSQCMMLADVSRGPASWRGNTSPCAAGYCGGGGAERKMSRRRGRAALGARRVSEGGVPSVADGRRTYRHSAALINQDGPQPTSDAG